MTSVKLPESATVPIDGIRPYWRNPRRITEEAIAKVAQSLRDYGWQQPIVTDREGVIIVGALLLQSERWGALRRWSN